MNSIKKLLILALLGVCCSAAQINAGPLAEKAAAFDKLVAASHLPRGLVVNMQPIAGSAGLRFRSAGDSTIWTGAYIASQVYRYRVSGDSAALEQIEKCLTAFVHLHNMAGRQGFIGRSYGTREELGDGPDIIAGIGSYSQLCFKADTSRDQYTGIFMGCALAWPHIRDPQLREEVRAMITAAAGNLMANHLALRVNINGQAPTTFNLNPDYAYQDRINPEEWARVDDFPANLFVAAVPYSDRLAAIMGRFKPPAVRGGEALRALLMFQTAGNISENRALVEYFHENLLKQRQLHLIASETSQLLSDIYLGRNQAVVENRLYGTISAAGKVFIYVQDMRTVIPDSLALWLQPCTMLPVNLAAAFYTEKIMQIFAFIRQPGAMSLCTVVADHLTKMAASLGMFRAERAAARLDNYAQQLRSFAASNLDEFSDTMRSYVGCNLGFFALLGILDQPSSPLLREAALAILPRSFEPISDEANSMYTFITAAFCRQAVSDQALAAARQTLLLYPENQLNRQFDHRGTLAASPWPDRFGRVGRQSRQLIPIDQRAPHIFIWQEPPRQLVTGSDDQTRVAPVGYLLAYWFGRYHALLNEND